MGILDPRNIDHFCGSDMGLTKTKFVAKIFIGLRYYDKSRKSVESISTHVDSKRSKITHMGRPSWPQPLKPTHKQSVYLWWWQYIKARFHYHDDSINKLNVIVVVAHTFIMIKIGIIRYNIFLKKNDSDILVLSLGINALP